MKPKAYYTTVAIVFTVVGTLHFARLVGEWKAVLGGVEIPLWVSGAAILIAGYLALRGYWLAHNKR